MRKLLLLFCLPSLAIQAQDTTLEKFIDSLMAPASRPGMPATYLIIASDGKPLLTKTYGMANLELGVPARPEHLFALASVNKQMIAVAMLQLANQGKLKLSDDIRKYLPDFNTHGRLVTIEQLLNHTNGLHSETVNTGAKGKTLLELALTEGMLSEKDFLEYTMRQDLFFEPGTDWGFNTHGFYIAFFIVEKVSGMPFNEYMRKNVFEPAGMTNSFCRVDGNRLGMFGIKNYVHNFYFPDADGKWIWRDIRKLLPILFYERYAVVTNLQDLVKWDAALREGKILPRQWVEKAWTPNLLKDGRSTNYGLGWTVSKYNDFRLLTHVGVGNNPICVVHVPEKKLYLACTQFYGNFEQCELLLKKILSRLLPLPYPSPTKADAPLTDYVGVYDIYRIGLRSTPQQSDVPVYINVTTSGDTLYIQQTGTEKTWLRPAGKDRFLQARSENTWYIFKRDAGGQVNAMTTEGSFWTYGPDVINKKVNISLPKPVQAISVSAETLRNYTGTYYSAAFDLYRFVETDGAKLYHKFQGALQELIPVADKKFVRKGVEDISFEFLGNKDEVKTLRIKSLRAIDFKKID